MSKKDDKMSLLAILKSLFTGGKSDVKKMIEKDPDLLDNLKGIKGIFTDSLDELERMAKKYDV